MKLQLVRRAQAGGESAGHGEEPGAVTPARGRPDRVRPGTALVAAVGAGPGGRVPGPGAVPALAEPSPGGAAGQPGRVRVPDRGPGAGPRRGAVGLLLRDPVPGRV